MKKNYAVVVAFAVAAWVLPGCAFAQASMPVTKILVGFPPGGNIDFTARVLGRDAGKRLAKTVIVESRIGAGGAIAAEAVARAQPDGNTLLLASSLNAILPSVVKQLRFDPVGDFEWVGTFTRYPLVIAVPRNSPYSSLIELLNAARENPGKISFGSAGLGTTMHLAGEMVAHSAKVKFLHIPYKGEMPSLVDAVGGQVDFVVLSAPTALARLRSGDLRALAVTSDSRWRLSPATPTVSQSGYPEFNIMSWVGLAAPKGTSASEVLRINDAFQQAQLVPQVREQIESTGVELFSLSPAQTRELMQREVRLWKERLTAAGITAE